MRRWSAGNFASPRKEIKTHRLLPRLFSVETRVRSLLSVAFEFACESVLFSLSLDVGFAVTANNHLDLSIK